MTVACFWNFPFCKFANVVDSSAFYLTEKWRNNIEEDNLWNLGGFVVKLEFFETKNISAQIGDSCSRHVFSEQNLDNVRPRGAERRRDLQFCSCSGHSGPWEDSGRRGGNLRVTRLLCRATRTDKKQKCSARLSFSIRDNFVFLRKRKSVLFREKRWK